MPPFRPQLFHRAPLSHRAFSTSPRPAHYARITLIGRLGAEPELVATSSGRDLVRYVIGTNWGPRDDRQTSWWKVANFDERTKDILLAMPKGSLMHIEAEAHMRSFEDKEGQKRSQIDLIQRTFTVLQRAPDRTAGHGESEISPAEEPSSGVGAS